MQNSLQMLSSYVQNNSIAWQAMDSLMEFSNTEAAVDSCEALKDNELYSAIASAKTIAILNPRLDTFDGFEEIVEWSDDMDTLLLVDGEVLLAIPRCDADIIAKIVA